MSRYIDIEPYEKDGWYLQKRYRNSYGEVIKTTPLISVPTADAEPVKHGHWIDEGLVDGNQNRYCRCSECGKGDTQAISQRVPYCWWCGAKMGERKEDETD